MALFGTDGVRGLFGKPPIDEATIGALGRALSSDLRDRNDTPRVVIGGDTRASTPTLFGWIAAGLAAGGVDVRWAGVLPTPGVAALTRLTGSDCGLALSASHNPSHDNGVKLFDADGFKWSSEAENRLEAALEMGAPTGAEPRIEVDAALPEAYVDEICSTLGSEPTPLAGLTLAIDCANGAAAPLAREVFQRLGATVHCFHDEPDGDNINHRCGSTYDQEIVRLVKHTSADLGFAFDGDADRLIAVDQEGRILDGDILLYAWASRLRERGALEPARIVATQMSNLGLEESLRTRGIDVTRCDVGDRAVVAEMRRQSLVLGGEQSGHLVNLALSTTGDGLLSAIHIARLASPDGLGPWVDSFVRYPQVLINVPVAAKPDFATLPRVTRTARDLETTLGSSGRLLLRYSGTEPLARVMIEGRDRETIASMAQRLANAIEAEIGVPAR